METSGAIHLFYSVNSAEVAEMLLKGPLKEFYRWKDACLLLKRQRENFRLPGYFFPKNCFITTEEMFSLGKKHFPKVILANAVGLACLACMDDCIEVA